MKSNNCCEKDGKKLVKRGFLMGLLPHSFCFLFIVFSLLGLTGLSALVRPLLLSRNFFFYLLLISVLLAVISSCVYLFRLGELSLSGAKHNGRFLSILFASMVGVNLVLYLIVFPMVGNLKGTSKVLAGEGISQKGRLKVAVPCSGHAPLIIDEVKKENGVLGVTYQFPDIFTVVYNPKQTSISSILSSPIFKSFPANLL